MPALVLLLFVALAAVSAVRTQIECVDAARDAALAAARGDDGVAAGARTAPTGATIGVSDSGGDVRATVSLRLRPLGAHLPGVSISATAVAAKEPSAP
jgi:Flp pilus assembly protein TadG